MPQSHFVQHKFKTSWPRNKPRPQWWQASG